MVANIRSGSSPGGALRYNKEKLDKDKAEVLLWQKMLEPFDKHGRMDVEGLATARSEHLPPPLQPNNKRLQPVGERFKKLLSHLND